MNAYLGHVACDSSPATLKMLHIPLPNHWLMSSLLISVLALCGLLPGSEYSMMMIYSHFVSFLPSVTCALHHAFTPLLYIDAAKNMQGTAAHRHCQAAAIWDILHTNQSARH